MDFTLKTYQSLLHSLQQQGFSFQRFDQFLEKPASKVVVLRHDVDLLPANSLRTAQLENQLGIVGSYYFRTVTQSFDETIIKQIAALGHEIGYHYETMVTCRGNVDRAYDELCRNLEKFRKLVPVKTICMHGSPLSKYDNRDIWKKYDYHTLGIIGEPYFDVDFSKVFYLTDTGRRWDGDMVSVRDKITKDITTKWPACHSTSDIIRAININHFPETAMITIHPQRWSDKPLPWVKELVLQNMKNVVKGMLILRAPPDP